MILTVTPNPSIDISYKLNGFKLDDVNRCNQVIKTPGGKGLNVTRVLNQLGADVMATGFIGGYTGQFILEELNRMGIKNSFTVTDTNTRNCIAILHDNNQTEILEASDEIKKIYDDKFRSEIKSLIKSSNVVTCSGSLPVGIADDLYDYILEVSKDTDSKVILDTSGKRLIDAIKGENKPFAIKPNLDELRAILSEIVDFNELDLKSRGIKELLLDEVFDGIDLIIVSDGKNGGYYRYGDEVYKISIPLVEVKNPVGSGDSTVAGLAYSLDEIDRKVNEAAKILGLEEVLDRKPGELSGGQKQRVAMGRAIVRNPKVFLMDEPLSNLDAKLRGQLRVEIAKLYSELDSTFIYVTHDQVEAMTLGTRIVVMKDGVIQQIDNPENLFRYPKNKFVAGFIGTPPMNFIDSIIRKEPNHATVELFGKEIRLNEQKYKIVSRKCKDLDKVIVGIRPEDLKIYRLSEDINPHCICKVEFYEILGSEAIVHLKTNESGIKLVGKIDSGISIKKGDMVNVKLNMDKVHIFNAKNEETITN